MKDQSCVASGSARAGLLPALLLNVARADTVSLFTDRAAFTAALPGPAQTLDFDSMSAGDIIGNGNAVNGITFTYDVLAGFDVSLMVVSDIYETSSAPNFLGTDDGYVLQGGDAFDLSFVAPINAIGLSFITNDDMLDGDIILTVGENSAYLLGAAVQSTLADGSKVFFLGIIDTASAFLSASITSRNGGEFLYNVDDITRSAVAVPAPSSCVLLLSLSVAGIAVATRRRRRVA